MDLDPAASTLRLRLRRGKLAPLLIPKSLTSRFSSRRAPLFLDGVAVFGSISGLTTAEQGLSHV
jgi:hypothetical protein